MKKTIASLPNTKVHKDDTFTNSATFTKSTILIADMDYSTLKDRSKFTVIVIQDSVTEIKEYAFSDCTSLRKILLPDSVKKIGFGAFSGCTALKEIVIPNSVKEIEYSAFSGCASLKKIVIPNSVKKIGSMAFDGCTALKEIVIPNSVKEIEHGTFYGCTSLKRIVIPNSIKKIECSAFDGCTALKGIIIPNSVKEIEHDTFYGCTSLKIVVIPNSVKRIGYRAFDGCTALKEIVIPNSVKEIEYSAFSGCANLKKIVIPKSVKRLCSYSFHGCDSLEDAIICASAIEGYAFASCPNMKHLYLTDTVKIVDDNAFERCTGLSEIRISRNNHQLCSNINSEAYLSSPDFLKLGKTDTRIPVSLKKICEDSLFFRCEWNWYQQQIEQQNALQEEKYRVLSAWLRAHGRNEIQIIENEPLKDELPLGSSKIGGRPDVPEGFEWPRDFDGNPYSLILQIDCNDLCEVDKDNVLPHSGHFYVFYEYQNEKWDDGIFHAHGDEAYWSQKKEDGFFYYSDAPIASLHREDFPEGMDEWSRFEEKPVSFESVISYPWKLSNKLGCPYDSSDIRSIPHNYVYDDIKPNVSPIEHKVIGRLLGYPEEFELYSYQEDDILLIELSSGLETSYMFGDAADIVFYIKAQDLKEGSLSKYRYICTDGWWYSDD